MVPLQTAHHGGLLLRQWPRGLLHEAQTAERIVAQLPLQALCIDIAADAFGDVAARCLLVTCHSSLLPLVVGGEAREMVGAQVEQKHLVVGLNVDVAIVGEPDVAYAVRRHVATVACLLLDVVELVAVEAAQTVPCSYPKQPAGVLQYLGGMSFECTVGLVIAVEQPRLLSGDNSR